MALDSLAEYISYLHKLSILQEYNIRLELKKSFISFLSINLLGQRVDLLGIITIEEKLHAVLSLDFPRTLKELETYLGLVGYFYTKI